MPWNLRLPAISRAFPAKELAGYPSRSTGRTSIAATGRTKREYGWNDTWVAGYSNDVFAYIPSLRVLHEGGYEGGGAMIPYGLPSRFQSSVEDLVAGAVDDLMHPHD